MGLSDTENFTGLGPRSQEISYLGAHGGLRVSQYLLTCRAGHSLQPVLGVPNKTLLRGCPRGKARLPAVAGCGLGVSRRRTLPSYLR